MYWFTILIAATVVQAVRFGEKNPELAFVQTGSFMKNIKNAFSGPDVRGSTVGNMMLGLADAINPGGCIGATLSSGYTNDAMGEDDYPYMASCHGAGDDNTLSCFPGEALLISPQGLIEMKYVQPGDKVAVGIKEGKLLFESVLYFLHRDFSAIPEKWVTLETADRHRLTLSSEHLLFVCSRSSDDSCVPVAAKRVQVGDIIQSLSVSSGSSSVFARTAIKHVERSGFRQGLFAHVTSSGTLIVDGVLASQFASHRNFPAHWDGRVHKLGTWILSVGVSKILSVDSNMKLSEFVYFWINAVRPWVERYLNWMTNLFQFDQVKLGPIF